MQEHVTFIAWAYLFLGVIGCFIVGLIFYSAGGFGSLGITEVVLLMLLCLPFVTVGLGLLGRKSWARVSAIALGVVIVPAVPIGTFIGGYGIWALTRKETKEVFRVRI